jgi:peroxiredoxin
LFGCAQENKKHLKIGDQAPSFNVEAITGGQVSLEAYKGNPVILRFWSTDCKYCRADTPIFNQYFDEYKGKGLKVVYINTAADNAGEVKDFIADLDIQFPVVLDTGGKIAESYGVKIVPQTIILNPEHKIITGILGGVSEAELQELLGPFF